MIHQESLGGGVIAHLQMKSRILTKHLKKKKNLYKTSHCLLLLGSCSIPQIPSIMAKCTQIHNQEFNCTESSRPERRRSVILGPSPEPTHVSDWFCAIHQCRMTMEEETCSTALLRKRTPGRVCFHV